MLKEFKFKSIKTRIYFWAYIFGLVSFIIFNIIIYFHLKEVQLQSFSNKLEAVRDIKVDEIDKWIDNIKNSIYKMSIEHELLELKNINQTDKILSAENEKKINIVRNYLLINLENDINFNEIFFIDNSGQVLISTDKKHEGDDHSTKNDFIEPIKTNNIYIKNIYSPTLKNNPVMHFSIPVNSSGKNIGTLVAVINLEPFLYRILTNRNGMGKTGETFISDKNGTVLSELLWNEKGLLDLTITSKDVLNASNNKTGIIETEDYRGEKVLSAYTYVPKTNWVFIAKQDLNEIYLPVNNPSMYFYIFVLFAISAISLTATYHANLISNPLNKIIYIASKIEKGDLAARICIDRIDEMGSMAKSFNSMANSLESQIKIQKNNIELAELMLIPKNINEFAEQIIIKLVEVTNSCFGAFYIKDISTGDFKHIASIGLNIEMVRSFNSAKFEGELGKPLCTRNISYINGLPSDTIFKFKTIAGDIIPREIVTIPIQINSQIEAIISMGTLLEYTKEDANILKQVNLNIDTAFSDIVANEKIKTLAEDLQKKNEEIIKYNDELKHQSIELIQQKEELEEQTKKLQKQTEELEAQKNQVEETTRLKSEFLSNMSHELRTPLTSIMGLSQLMLSQGTGNNFEMDKKYLTIIERNGERLLGLINDILDLSKIEANHMTIDLNEFNPQQVVESALEVVYPIAKKKKLEININIGNVPYIFSDEDKVMQILLNLLSNAVKFTEKGEIKINISTDNKKILFTVIDSGIGISEENCKYIFDEFRQVDGSTTRKYEGTGLGLTISQKLATLLKGKIIVKSELGKGSEFTLILPLEYSKDHKQETKHLDEIEQPIKLKVEQYIKRTILIIDDDLEIINIYKNYLIEIGYNVITANNGKDGLSLAIKIHPYIILLDVIIPEMDGWEVIKELKAKEDTKAIPIIIITINEDYDASIAMGASGYLVKPIKKETLLKELNRITSLSTAKDDKPNILVVEDNEVAVIQIQTALVENGYNIAVASDGVEALKYVEGKIPDAIVLDLMMPNIDGFQVLEQIRSNELTRMIPVLVLTAKELTKEDKSRLKYNNINQLIQKGSINREELIKCVKNLFNKLPALKPINPAINTIPISTNKEKTILIVEDSKDNMFTISNIIDSIGYKHFMAENGYEAVSSAKKNLPSLILMDIQLPLLSGLEAAKQIRECPDLKNIPIIALTAKAMKGDREDILASGCNDYLAKPLNPDKLKELIFKWIGVV